MEKGSFQDESTARSMNKTRAVQNADMSVLINESTSKVGRNVISRLNDESMFKRDLVDGSILGNSRVNKSTTFLKAGQNILGPQVPLKLTEDAPSAEQMQKMINSTKNLPKMDARSVNPNMLPKPRIAEGEITEIKKYWKKEEMKKKGIDMSKYVENLLERIENMEEKRKDFKNYEQAELDSKDNEIRVMSVYKKYVITQKEVDEERRKETESRLRDIFKDPVVESTGYSPVEGFLLSIDFM